MFKVRVKKLSLSIFVYIVVLRRRSEREYHKGDEIAWYADGDKTTVRNEYNPMTAYAFGKLR